MKYLITLTSLVGLACILGSFTAKTRNHAKDIERTRTEQAISVQREIERQCLLAFPKSRAMHESCVRQANGGEA